MTCQKEKAILWDTPPSVSKLIGYMDFRQQLIEEFFHKDKPMNRFARIVGFAGVGKSAIARHTVNYVMERGFLDGGCIYVDLY